MDKYGIHKGANNMKKLSYGISWICIVLLLCMAYYGSYELGQKKQKEQLQTEHIQNETREVNSDGKNAYVLKEKNGEVQVYQSDGKTLYESTGIPVSALPQEMQEEITNGKSIKDSASLYSFLENYSS